MVVGKYKVIVIEPTFGNLIGGSPGLL